MDTRISIIRWRNKTELYIIDIALSGKSLLDPGVNFTSVEEICIFKNDCLSFIPRDTCSLEQIISQTIPLVRLYPRFVYQDGYVSHYFAETILDIFTGTSAVSVKQQSVPVTRRE